MTLDDAKAAARRESDLFGLSMTVYRLPAWVPGVYSVRRREKLPSEAEQVETCEPAPGLAVGQPDAPAPAPEPVTGQGSLFS